jgi:uncharacterized damage-inducible protein DinB
MDALTLLTETAGNADTILKQVFQPVTPEQAIWKLPGSQANTIGATFLHSYQSEDDAVHALLGRPSEFESGGWAVRLRVDPADIWSLKDPDLDQLRAYAEAVSGTTKEYLAGLPSEALDGMIETRRGPRPLASRLGIYLVVHKFQHVGDIAALLGCQGVKGLPF